MTLEEALQKPNVVSAVPLPDGSTVVTFHTHRPAGTREYVFPPDEKTELAKLLLEALL